MTGERDWITYNLWRGSIIISAFTISAAVLQHLQRYAKIKIGKKCLNVSLILVKTESRQ